jgi:HSP20 family protein
MLTLKKLAPISAFEPFAPLTEMSNRYRALFGEPFADLFAPTGWVPPVEIAETEEKLVITAELPGMRPEECQIVLRDNVLTLSGEKKAEGVEEKENVRYLTYERTFGVFVRSFTLPTMVATDKAVATFHDGILRIELPKTVEAKGREIPIRQN